MKHLIILFAIVSAGAFAGKKERTYNKEIVKPAVAAAEKAFKTSCGCSVKITYKGLTSSKDHLNLVRSTVNSFKKEVEKHCTDKESKAAVCVMKKFVNQKAKKTVLSSKAAQSLSTQTYLPTFQETWSSTSSTYKICPLGISKSPCRFGRGFFFGSYSKG